MRRPIAISKVEQKKLAEIYDSIVCVVSPTMSIEEEQELRDSVFGLNNEKLPTIWDGGNFLGWEIKEYAVTRDDAYTMDIDSLFDKYELTKWYDQLFIRQLITIRQQLMPMETSQYPVILIPLIYPLDNR